VSKPSAWRWSALHCYNHGRHEDMPRAISRRVSADVGMRYVEGGDIEQQVILAGVSRWLPSRPERRTIPATSAGGQTALDRTDAACLAKFGQAWTTQQDRATG
jgi:hypothetical protein